MTNYRLGLRINSNSIGWCVLDINEKNIPIGIKDWGVRVFKDGREPTKKGVPGEPLAILRTNIRSIRRNYARTAMRKRNVIKQLRKYEILPENYNFSDPAIIAINKLELRNKAVLEKLELYEIAITFFQLNKNRGFKSNRKDIQKSVNAELKGMKLGVSNLKMSLGNRTLGQFLYEHNKRDGTSRKFRPETDEKGKFLYNFYPSRDMVETEFNRIWDFQKQYHPEILNNEAYKVIHKAIFFQRPLKPQPKGKCTIFNCEDRMEWAIPSAQKFRIIKEVNNLAFTAPQDMRGIKLSRSERQCLYNELCKKDSLTFRQINKLLGLSSSYEFNLDTNGRNKLEGDRVSKLMRDKDCFGDIWDKLPLTEQDKILYKLLDSSIDDETLAYSLITDYKISISQAKKIINVVLPNGVSNFGTTVITSILPKMLQEGMLEHEALESCGWKILNNYLKSKYYTLPYYGEILSKHVVRNDLSSDPMIKEFGRISNPSLHIALNQLRQLLNKLKQKYGYWPDNIIIQVDRNLKKGTKEITNIIKTQGINIKQREKWQNEIERYKGGIAATSEDYLKMKLWEELAEDPLHRKCIYSGKTINMSMLFSEGEILIDYILPYSKTLDNTSANLVLTTAQGAYIKKNQIPYEAFFHQIGEYSYDNIIERSRNLPKSKQWRFLPNAMEIFRDKATNIQLKSSVDGTLETIETGLEPFAINTLCDTAYVAKLIKKYLSYACKKAEYGVIATPGNLTGLLRSTWGLNDLLPKDYPDHRMNTIDAFVLSLTTYYTVCKVVEAAKVAENKGVKLTKILRQNPPYPAFDWENTQKHLKERVIVCYKPHHRIMRKLHDDTYYGYINNTKPNISSIVIKRPISNIKTKEDIECIIDNHSLKNFIGERTDIELAFKEFITKTTNITWRKMRSIRVKDEKPTNILITKNESLKMLAQGGSNHRAEIYCSNSGENANKWQMEIIKTFDANQKDFISSWKKKYPEAKLIMVLHSNDMVIYEEEGRKIITKVKKISSNKTITLVPHYLTKEKEEENMWNASAKQLQLKNAHHILVSMVGNASNPAGIFINNNI